MLVSKTKRVRNITVPAISAAAIDRRLKPILRAMESRGVQIDTRQLNRLEAELETEIETLRKKISDLAGEAVNLDSPRQLGALLFEKLELPTDQVRRRKSGFATDAETLRKLEQDFPIAGLLLRYRERSKLLSTYVRPLPRLVDRTGRLHTTYAPDTSSGRLSSRNPNLQNIPIRSAIGRKIRAAFVAGPGKLLIKADYSQVELRLAACFAHEPVMIAAFERNEDIHRTVAAEVLNKPPERVTEAERRFAKTINFGILYGMGAYGLGAALEIPQDEAQAFLERYFLTHQALRDYIQQELALARETGQVENCFGRKRQIPELLSPNGAIRRAGERMAINMPIQGTAAEMLKLAMIELAPKLLKLGAELLLTVHDELLIEGPREKARTVAKEVRATMEEVVRLCVPLVAVVEIGKNWAEMKPC